MTVFSNFTASAALLGVAIAFGSISTLAQESAETNAPTLEAEAESQLIEQEQYAAWAQDFLESLTMTTGRATLDDGLASINMGDSFYYLSPSDANRVLEEAWGNPPSDGGLGMLFPAAYTPLDGAAWGVTLSYEPIGYVSDENAADIDYADLLETMQADTKLASEARIEQGYESMDLVGWASTPYYDAVEKKLHWAKELKFGGMEENTLNYNVRILGRRGVLVLNFIASMNQLPEIQQNLPAVLSMTNFEQGNTYSEFDPSIDEVAAVGIGGLIAGKVLTKTGLLAGALIFLKKFWVVIFAGLAGLWKLLLGRKKQSKEDA